MILLEVAPYQVMRIGVGVAIRGRIISGLGILEAGGSVEQVLPRIVRIWGRCCVGSVENQMGRSRSRWFEVAIGQAAIFKDLNESKRGIM